MQTGYGAFSKHGRFQKQNHSVKLNWTPLFDITVLKASNLEDQKISVQKKCLYLLMINTLCANPWIYITLHSWKTLQLSPHERKWQTPPQKICIFASIYVHLSLSWGCIWATKVKRAAFVKNVRMKEFYLSEDCQKFPFGSVAMIQQ